MKKTLITIMLLTCYCAIAQYNASAPWMVALENEKKISGTDEKVTFDEITTAFDNYWKNRDHTKKGSGYKPFMRWREYWKNAVLPDGTLPSPAYLFATTDTKNKMALAKNGKAAPSWTPMGPFDHNQASSWSPGQGRINVGIIDPNNENIMYAGAPAGGIWKSTNKGVDWSPLSDNLPQIGVSGIAIDPKNSNIIYIATGDDDASDSYSIGVLKSTNGGASWSQTGLSFSNTQTTANDIYIDPNDSNVLWVATSAGVYKTTNAGANWTRTLQGNIKDIKLKPGNTNVIYAATASSFYKSTNAGNSFLKIQSGLPSSSGRLVIDVTPANPNYVYVLSARPRASSYSFQGLYRSTNSGDSFNKTAETTNIFESSQAWYDLALAVSDKNANTVFVGCLNVWKSTDGGGNFSKINNWSSPRQATYTHADIHFLRYYDGKLICGSDGGIYISENNGQSFKDLTKGLQIGQFYRISVAENSSADHIVGGLQDNGGYALNGNEWNNYYGADGMDCAVSGNNDNTYYGFIQNGSGLYVTRNRGASQSQIANGPETGNWITPLVSDKNGVLYAGYSSFYKLNGNSFEKLTNFNFGGKIDHIELDPINENIMYVGLKKNLFKSTNKGVNWTRIETFQTNISSIEVHNDDNQIVYISTSGSSNGGVFRSTNQGSNFTNISGNLPNEGKFIVRHQKGTASIYLGTYLGVYHKNGNNDWEDYSQNLPNVAVRDLEVNLKDQVLLAATYGRGVWKVPLVNATNSGDTEAPSIPTNVVASSITDTKLVLSWNASTDNVAVTGYDIYSGNTNLRSVTGTTAAINNLTANTTYEFRIKAKDEAGNESAFSATTSATTNGGVCTSSIVSFPYNEGFENTLGAWSQSTVDDINWSLDANGTPSNGTGPASATQGSYYMYVEASGNGTGYPNKRAILTSPCFDLTATTQASFTFSYHMNGAANMGSIAVEVSTDQGVNWTSIWSQTGNQGNSWKNVIIDLSSYTGGGIQLRFNRVTGATWQADIAIDKVAVLNTIVSADRCDGVSQYSTSISYQAGDGVVYQGNLWEKTATSWTYLGACGTSLVSTNSDVTGKKPPTLAANKLRIYPNPIKDAILNIVTKNLGTKPYTIYTMLGQIVDRGTFATTINVQALEAGVYFVKVGDQNVKFVKE
ncbi:T9SS type A sorting domain-containing protein [uncultured Aquimarina sp.]|uniref:fibronectin type III domain-containing protein n=1 Tax=uncultured Aquimarina sp. TaxID=575652 RepID=UPI00261B521D|nr:T9SS type A sorting domain-containing protein [uncultured Aquimarina sp.]